MTDSLLQLYKNKKKKETKTKSPSIFSIEIKQVLEIQTEKKTSFRLGLSQIRRLILVRNH